MVDMIGSGMGGLIAGAWNPNLLPSVAQHITPNPNPLAQQGPGGAPSGSVDSLGNPVRQPPPGSNLAPAASTQPDPANAANISRLTQPDSSYALDMLRYQNLGRAAEGFNQGMDRMAASFGTAQQQASKQAALRGGDGSVGGNLGDLAKIQAMQDTTITDNERARFMGNAAVFAQTLSQSLGRPVSTAEASEIMANPDTLKAATTAMGANATTTADIKNADAAARAYAAANPNATPQDIANYKASLLAGTVGNLSAAGKSLMDDRRAWMLANPGKSFADMIAAKPELANEIAYTGAKTEEGKQMAQAGEDKLTASQSFPKVDQSYTQAESNIDWLNAHKDAVLKAVNTPDAFTKDTSGNLIYKFVPTSWTGISDDVLQARSKIDWLKNQLYQENFTGTKNLRSNTEANKLGASATNLDTRTNDADTVNQQLQQLQQGIYRAKANNFASAGKVVPYRYRGLADSTFLDPTSKLYNGGAEEQPATINGPDDIARLPSGRAFLVPSGPHKGEVGFAP